MPDHPRRAEIAVEQRFVDTVHRHLDAARARLAELRREGRARGSGGPPAGLVERDALAWRAQRRQAGLDAAEDGLVFGRLDHTDGTSLHLGRVGLRDEEHRTLLVDWRAPAAAAFYQATPGDPRGLRRRRVIRCAGRRVVDLDDDVFDADTGELALVGEGALMAALRRRRGPRMRDIVATIQREQDAAIRAPAEGLTEITGGPGTGKTQVALHRAAYLLYRDRRRLDAGRVLVVGPTPVFTGYIGAVLPGLGEDSVVLRALGELVDGVRATRRDPPDLAALKGSAVMPPVLAELAWQEPPGAPRRLRIVYAGQVLTVDSAGLAEVRARVRAGGGPPNAGRARAAGHLVHALWRDLCAAAVPGLAPRRDLFAEEVADRPELGRFLDAWWPVLTPAGVLAWLADPQRAARAGRGLLDAPAAAALAASYPGVASGDPAGWSVADVALLDELDQVLGRPPGRAAAPDPDTPAELTTWAQRTGREGYVLSRGLSGGWALYAAGDAMPLAATGPDFDDAPVLARRWARRVIAAAGERVTGWTAAQDPLGQPGFGAILEGEDATADDDGAPPVRGYAHIVVDEAQDLSPMQWRMLGRRSAQAGWTVVGDPAQSLWPDPQAARAARDTAVGSRTAIHRYELGTNYRTSAEIFAVAARVLAVAAPGQRPPRAVRVTGIAPRLDTVAPADLPAAAVRATRTLLGQVEGTVGVLAPAGRAAQVAAWLSGAADERLSVLDALDAKGLEYDAVLLVQPAEVVAAAGWSTLYVALTRATVRLWVLATDPKWLPQPR